MDLMIQKLYIHESESLSPITSPQIIGSPLHSSSHTSFPIIAVAIIGILATAFLLVSYYIFVIKCCLNWHRIDILRRFSFSRNRQVEDGLMVYNSPVVAESRGLNEAAIRSIPIFKFKKLSSEEEKDEVLNVKKSCECAVCLNEFQEGEKLRVIPNCGHFFHIDCIDVWLQNNANCPLCRTSISASRLDIQFPFNRVVISPSHSFQDNSNPRTDNFTGRDEDYVVIEIGTEHVHTTTSSRIPDNLSSDEFLTISPSPRKMETKISRKKGKKFNHVSSMGDECIVSRHKDEQFLVQPMRRSFSMDSAADSQLYLAVQEIIQRQKQVNNEVIISPNYEGCSSSSSSNSRVNKRSFFSFGQGRSSRSAVQPVGLEP